jgi:plastocyanin
MKKHRWMVSLAIAAVIAITITAGARKTRAAAPEAASGGPEVAIDNFMFTPAMLTVKAGTPITWTNHDDIPHTVVSDDKSFKSKVLDTDEKFTFTLSKPGMYSYFCSIHPKMVGKVVVQ